MGINAIDLRALTGRALLCFCAGLSGCSTYLGHKLGPNGELPAGGSGIPYTMTRPEYVVDVSADSENATVPVFTLKLNHVPDASQRYSLALDPALLTNGKIDMTLGEGGNLAEANATVTSQVVATIKSVAGFAVDVLASKSLKDEQSSVVSIYRVDLKIFDGCAANVRDAIAANMDEIRSRAEIAKMGSGDSAVVDRYYPHTAEQRECLQRFRQHLVSTTQQRDDKSRQAYEQRYSDLKKEIDNNPPPEIAAIALALPGWVKANDTASIKDALAYIQSQSEKPPVLQSALLYAQTFVNTKINSARLRDLAVLLGDMSPAVWKARYVRDLELQLSESRMRLDMLNSELSGLHELENSSKEKALSLRQQSTALARRIRMLEERHADALGALPVLLRIRKLDEFLAEIRETAGPDRRTRYAADEHVQIREERDKLAAQLKELAAGAVAGNAKDASKVAARSNVPVRIVQPSFIDAANKKPAVLFEDLPEYALVLEPIMEPAVADKPVSVGRK